MSWNYEKMKANYDNIQVRGPKGYREAINDLAGSENRTAANYIRNLISLDAERKKYPLKTKIKEYREQWEKEKAEKPTGGKKSEK